MLKVFLKKAKNVWASLLDWDRKIFYLMFLSLAHLNVNYCFAQESKTPTPQLNSVVNNSKIYSPFSKEAKSIQKDKIISRAPAQEPWDLKIIKNKVAQTNQNLNQITNRINQVQYDIAAKSNPLIYVGRQSPAYITITPPQLPPSRGHLSKN